MNRMGDWLRRCRMSLLECLQSAGIPSAYSMAYGVLLERACRRFGLMKTQQTPRVNTVETGPADKLTL